jgi:hypothetical protein
MVNLPPGIGLVAIGALFAAVGLLVGTKAVHLYRRSYRLLATEEYDALSVPADATAAVEGTVRTADGADPVTGALGAAGVVVYTELARYNTAGQGSNWDTFHWHYDGVPFSLDDGSGTVRVAPPRGDPDETGTVPAAEFDLPRTTRTLRSADPVPTALASYAEAVGGLRYGPGDRRLRIREAVVQPGDEVWVLGETERRLTTRGDEVVVAGDDHPERFTVSTPGGGSPGRNLLFAVFLTWFTVAGLGGGGLVLYEGLVRML